MKRYFFIIGIALAICSNAYTQAVQQGNSIIDATYGWPNLYTTVLKEAVTTTNSYAVKVSGLGPLALKYEYMIADRVGVGVAFNYANTSVEFNEKVITTEYDYKYTVPRIRAMAKFGFHFGSSEHFDGYTSVGVGYGSFSWNFVTNDPNCTGATLSSPIPVAFRLALGGRYFFTDNIGALVEFGLSGGGLLEFGLSAKF